jgi:ubiquinone/menaquinone biosynthesis C-methylase UbiE
MDAMRAEDPTAKQRRVWDTAARRYDKQIVLFERLLLGGGREWLGQRAQGRLLEVAIGTGRNLPYYSDDVRLTGVDLSLAMLDHARALAADLDREVDLREGDAAALPFADGSFDTVVCALALCSIPDPSHALAEMHRVLVPGGRLLLVDHIGSSWPPIYAVQWLTERVTTRLAGEYFTRRQRDSVVATGFELVETERLKAGMVERIHARKAG